MRVTRTLSPKTTDAKAANPGRAVVRFAVTDTGIGISQQAAQNLFQAFVQADGSTTRKYGGTGLGLAISKQLVELMGGEIGVESVPGKGSTFWFTVQLEKQASGKHSLAVTPLVELRGLRALIVDDNATNRRILAHQLASRGMLPTEADGGAALESLRAARREGAPYDVALLDFQMPGMDGLELARAIKADPELSAVRLVLMPSFGNRGDGQPAREAGIAAYLMKPVRQTQLFDCLATVMAETENAPAPETPLAGHFLTRHSLEETKHSSQMRILIAEDTHALQGEREKCLAAGMDDYLSKPVRAHELAAMLERWSVGGIQSPQTDQPSASSSRPALEETIDLAVLEGFRDLQQEGELDLISELIELYISDTQSRFTEMRVALKGQDAVTLQRVAHILKGSSSNLGINRMATLCSEMEETLRDRALDGVGTMMAGLDAEFERVMAALAGERQMVNQ